VPGRERVSEWISHDGNRRVCSLCLGRHLAVLEKLVVCSVD
jgi:hypothetical protein